MSLVWPCFKVDQQTLLLLIWHLLIIHLLTDFDNCIWYKCVAKARGFSVFLMESLAGHITRIMFGLKWQLVTLFTRPLCFWNLHFVTLAEEKYCSCFHLRKINNTWDLIALLMESVCVSSRGKCSHTVNDVWNKRKCVVDIKYVGVFFRPFVSLMFLLLNMKTVTEGSEEMDRRWRVERSERYSLTLWRMVGLSCLTKPLLIPAGLWMFRNVSDMNKRCQSSAVTFERCRLVAFGPVLRAATSSFQAQLWDSGLSFTGRMDNVCVTLCIRVTCTCV